MCYFYGTFYNTKVSTGCHKSAISTESSTNNNPGLNDTISSGVCERYHNGENCLCSFLMEEIKFLKSEKSKSMLHNHEGAFFSLITQQIKNCNKNFNQKTDNSNEILQGHVDKASNVYDVDKMIIISKS